MKTQNTPLANEIQKLSGLYLTAFKPSNLLRADTSTEIGIKGGYVELFNKIHSLISVCQSALLSQDAIQHPHTNEDLANLLELTADLLPLNEAEYLDRMRDLVPNEKKKN
jgi:hypothetical protein